MSDIAYTDGAAQSRPRAATQAFRARILSAPDLALQALSQANARGAATVFQSPLWCQSWYANFCTMPGDAPLVIEVCDERTGVLAAILPLRRTVRDGLATITFLDEDLCDINAPILGPAAPVEPGSAKAFFAAVLRALPQADLLDLRKLAGQIEGRINPLTLLASIGKSALSSHALDLGDNFETWHFDLDRRFRKELERSWRVFTREPDARFVRAQDTATALKLFTALELQQAERMREVGAPFRLNEPAPAQFYRDMIRGGIESGETIITALISGDEVIAALMGFRRGDTYLMVRISNAGSEWANCSPGRLIIHRTMMALHAEGVRKVDFSIGEYAYKRRFGIGTEPMFELVRPLSLKGVPLALKAAARRWLADRPELELKLRKLLGRPMRLTGSEMDHFKRPEEPEAAEPAEKPERAKAA
jgi:CelD/BcsL family acetyltransferase involved in cellulose biosynthesis